MALPDSHSRTTETSLQRAADSQQLRKDVLTGRGEQMCAGVLGGLWNFSPLGKPEPDICYHLEKTEKQCYAEGESKEEQTRHGSWFKLLKSMRPDMRSR